MKWLLLLSLFGLLACTTQKKPEEGTESDSRPVSPLTIEPCYCMKIFKPVCADGINYGNSCEAECHGHKTWKDGNCPPTKK